MFDEFVTAKSPTENSVHQPQAAGDFGCAYITPQLKVTQPCRRSTIGCYLVTLPNQRAVTDRRASACDQAATSHALYANKLFLVTRRL